MDMDNLELVSTESLLTEIKNRFDSMFFIGYKNTTTRRDDYQCATNASIHEIYGLLEMAKMIVSEKADD